MGWKEWPGWVKNVLFSVTALVIFALIFSMIYSIRLTTLTDLFRIFNLSFLLPFMTLVPPLLFIWIMGWVRGLVYGSIISLVYNLFDFILRRSHVTNLPCSDFCGLANFLMGSFSVVLLILGCIFWFYSSAKESSDFSVKVKN